MLGRLNHVAIAVPDLAKGTEVYRAMLGAKVSAPQAEPAHGVTVVFVELPNTPSKPFRCGFIVNACILIHTLALAQI